MTQRINIGDGKWFDLDAAKSFRECTRHNGNNHIPVTTGDQWSHTRLYRTASGTWILNRWSDWQGSLETYEILDESDAYDWLIENEHYTHVPESMLTDREL